MKWLQRFLTINIEVSMATQATLDALNAAAAQLDKSRAASVAATEALIAALGTAQPAPDDTAIMGVVSEINSQSAALDVETAKATAAVAPPAPPAA